MTNPRGKKDILSQTTISYLYQLFGEIEYGKYENLANKFLQKGNETEEDGIKLCERVLDVGFLYKNHEKFENDYIKGTPDVNTSDILIDVKSKWDFKTYCSVLFSDKIPDKSYYYQLQGYMWLTGKKECYLCYCLLNTPDQLVEDEIYKLCRFNNVIDDKEMRFDVEKNHNFDNIEDAKRIKTFKIKYDQNVIDQFKTRIDECRLYYDHLKTYLDKHITITETI